jgi:hypothetical protein
MTPGARAELDAKLARILADALVRELREETAKSAAPPESPRNGDGRTAA